MSRETNEEFHPVDRRMPYTPRGEVIKLISLAKWLLDNAEASREVYLDPQARGIWRRTREKWLTQANDLLL